MLRLGAHAQKLKALGFGKHRPVFCFATKKLPLPSIAESIKDVTVLNYLKQEGEVVEQDDEILEVETHKGNFKVRSSAGGKILKFLVEPSQDVEIGVEYVEIDTEGKAGPSSGEPESAKSQDKQDTPEKKAGDEEKTQPKEKGSQAKPKGKVVEKESDSLSQKKPEKREEPREETPKKREEPREETPKKSQPAQDQKAPKTETPKPQEQKQSAPKKPQQTGSYVREETREKMSRMRRTVAQRLKESQNTNAQVTTLQELDMSEIMRMRKELGEDFQKRNGVKLGFMSFFVKAVAKALTERPVVNSVISPEGNEIIHRNFVDISVAVSSPKGLVVPVLRDVQNKTFAEIEQDLAELVSKAANNQLALEDMEGGTFTISNGGVFGSMMSIPIINPPQTAVLGMHNIVNRPVVRGDQIVARPIMYLSMSYDHRLCDGREGAGFLKRVSDLLEDPRKMLLEF